jgi:hypothetical protein
MDVHSLRWELLHYGVGEGHQNGLRGQFPGAFDSDEEMYCVIDQIEAGCLGFVDHPTPGFYEVKQLRRIRGTVKA